MVLSIEERIIFYKNWLKLLTYVNNEFRIIDGFGEPNNPVGLNINDLMKIREELWKNINVIDKYIKTSNLNIEDFYLVNSWKNCIKGKYLLIKELKKYCVFLDINKNNLYGVYGISSPFSQMVPCFPFMIETVLIPFNGKIIYDSLITSHNITFGSNMKKSFNEQYSEIKKEKGIAISLE